MRHNIAYVQDLAHEAGSIHLGVPGVMVEQRINIRVPEKHWYRSWGIRRTGQGAERTDGERLPSH